MSLKFRFTRMFYTNKITYNSITLVLYYRYYIIVPYCYVKYLYTMHELFETEMILDNISNQ